MPVKGGYFSRNKVVERARIKLKEVNIKMHCQHCGAFISETKPGTTIIEVTEEFRKGRPDLAKHVYLCPKEKCSKKIEQLKTYPWYAGHRIV